MLILFAKLALHRFRLLQHHIQNTAVQLELLPLLGLGCGMATGTHSTKNLPLLLAGGGFKHGESKIYPEADAQRVPAANLLLSMLQNFGVEADRFGTSSGTLTGLERKA